MGGFFGPKFSKQGSLFGRFSINKGGLSKNWRKIAKNGWFSAKIHHESGYDGNFRQLEEGAFLKAGRQTPVHPQVMYPPPGVHDQLMEFLKGQNRLCLNQFAFQKLHSTPGADPDRCNRCKCIGQSQMIDNLEVCRKIFYQTQIILTFQTPPSLCCHCFFVATSQPQTRVQKPWPTIRPIIQKNKVSSKQLR